MLPLTLIQNRYKGLIFAEGHANEQKQANYVGSDDDFDVGYTLLRKHCC